MLTAIEEHLSKGGNRAATVYKGRRRSFRELDLHSRRLADALQVPPDTAPGLAACITDADNMVIAFLASLRISTSCNPLRASSSAAELASVLKELRPCFVLVDSTTASRIPQDQKTVNMEEYLREGTTEPEAPPQQTCPPGGSATQVSTRPLLQFLGHESDGGSSLTAERCLNRHQWEWKEWPAADLETVAVLDDVDSARFWEDVLGALCSGSTVALASEEEKRSPSMLLQFLRDTSATRIETTPDRLWALLKRASMEPEKSPLPLLRLVKCSRGLLSTELVSLLHHVLPQTRLAYVYEHAGHCCVYQCPAEIGGLRHHRIANGDFVVLGKPVGGCRAVVRGANRAKCPQGVTGALCLGGAKGADEVPTGDIGFVDSDGYVVLTSASTPWIDGRKVDMAFISEHLKDTPGLRDAELCWEYTTSGRATLVAFYWSRAGGDRSGELFHHLYPTVPYHWVPRFFPLGPPPPAGQRPGTAALLAEYSAAVGKLLSCGEPNALRGAPVLVAIARSLKIPVAQIDANASYSSQASGKGAASAAETSALIEHIGYEVSVAALEGPRPLSKVVENAACSLVLPGLRKMRVSTLDANTPFDEVAALQASCFTAKNRLCTTMGLTREEFVDYLRHLWTQFVDDAATPLVRDESGRLVAAAISGDFGAEFPLPENISEAFVITLEINDVLERRLRALTCDQGRRMLLCFMVGCSLENKSDDNIALVQQLYANVLHKAHRLGYGGASSTNSHVVTNIVTQRWFDFFIFDNALVADFEYKGRRPFASVKPGTLITSMCKFLE